MKRNFAMDSIRIYLTALVVFHHAAIAYGGSGGWYWRELPNASNRWLLAFNCINQSYFMGLFFLLAGYFSAAARGRKSIGEFVFDRLLRLGIPLLVFYFVLAPVTMALAQMTSFANFSAALASAFDRQEFGPGPQWFAAALLGMSLVYLLLEPWVSRWSVVALPAFPRLLLTLVCLGLVSFAIRLIIPVGENWLWMQWGYFAPYIWLFAVGVLSYNSRLLERIRWRDCRPWLALSGLALAVLAWVLNFGLGTGRFEGGWSTNALFYALWDPLFAAGISLGLLWATHSYWAVHAPSWVMQFLARRAYLIFILHAPLLVAWSRLAASWTMAPVAKLLVVGSITVMSAALVGSLVLMLPRTQRVF